MYFLWYLYLIILVSDSFFNVILVFGLVCAALPAQPIFLTPLKLPAASIYNITQGRPVSIIGNIMFFELVLKNEGSN